MSQHKLPTRREYDFIILGGGSAGYAAARTAGKLGLTTLVVEGGEEVGGLCILRGCMPSKTVIESANRMLTLRRAAEFGLRAENLRVEAGEILARKRRMVEDFASYRRGQLANGSFEFVRGFGRFVDAHTLEILDPDNERLAEVRGKAFLLATGSVVACPEMPGLAETGYLTSDHALELDHIPKSLIILGSGPIAMEAAHHLSGLGAKVTVINRGGQVVREVDADVAAAVQHAMEARGVDFRLGTKVLEISGTGGHKRVRFSDASGEHTVEATDILCALGRRPATDRLGLESVPGLTVEHGRPRTETTQRTTAGHVYAAGDVCGPHEIVHLAIQQGEIAARNAARAQGKLAGEDERMDYRVKMFCVFTHPQIGVVGLSEREAKAEGREVDVATYPFSDHGKSMVMGETEGFVKLIADRRDGKIVGGAVVGPEGSELIHEIGVAMHFRATARDLALAPHYHPTLSEIWTYPAEELAGM